MNVYVNVYRFAVYIVRFWAELEVVRGVGSEADRGRGRYRKSGSKGRVIGFGHEKPGTAVDLVD